MREEDFLRGFLHRAGHQLICRLQHQEWARLLSTCALIQYAGEFRFSFMNFCILLYSSSNFSLYVDRLYTKCLCLGGPFLSTLLYPSLILTSDLLLTLLVVGGRIMISFLTFGSQDFWGS
jgi:hypothetical protein